MTDIASKFGLGGGGGVHFTDPREFMRSVAVTSSFVNYTAGASAADASGAGFFTEQARRGLVDDTNWTADTYKTILNVSSGMGLVFGMIGPAGLAGTPSTTVEITVDGVLTTLPPITATTTNYRAGLGAFAPINSMFTTSATFAYGPDAQLTGVDAARISTNQLIVPPWHTIRFFGTPCLIYRTSLLIRMKSSESNSTTANKERQACVQYMVMA